MSRKIMLNKKWAWIRPQNIWVILLTPSFKARLKAGLIV